MNSPAQAILWDLWRRNRIARWTMAVLLTVGFVLSWSARGGAPHAGFAFAAGHGLMAVLMIVLFGSLHFTEGRLRGGFGTFPARLFHLPATTRLLVGVPLIAGVTAVILLYLAASCLILWPLGDRPPLLWPCLYLVTGFVLYESVIWAMPESRYLKLLLLAVAASAITFMWMFFLPHMVEGTLADWGYTGSVTRFKTALFLGLTAASVGACGVSYYRVRQQRHGVSGTNGWRTLERSIGRLRRMTTRQRPFQSGVEALRWREWRQSGWILPMVTAVVIGMTCVPSFLSAPLGTRVTVGLLNWLLLTPLLLAVILGIGFAKVDFWSSDLAITPFHAVRPVTVGDWVMIKLGVATRSVLLTWGILFYAGFVWLAFAGDFTALDHFLDELRMRYTPVRAAIVVGWGFLAAVLLTWRFMVHALPIGLSGVMRWFRVLGFGVAAALTALLTLTLWQSDNENPPLQLHRFWGAISSLPWILAVILGVRFHLAASAWTKVLRQRLLPPQRIRNYFLRWALATAALAGGAFITFPHADWMRNLALMVALGWVPLASPGFAIVALARNRSGA